jgi:hypothetical protein
MSEITVNKIKILSGSQLQIAGQVAGEAATRPDQFVTLAQISTTTEGGVTQAYVQAEALNALNTAKTYSDSKDTAQSDTLTSLMISKDTTTLTAAKAYADSLVTSSEAGSIILFDQTTTGTATLTLPTGSWLCECYGAVYQCQFNAYNVTIDGIISMTTLNNGDQEGCAYSPIAGIERVEVTGATRDIVFICTAGGQAHMVVKATKLI